MVSTFERFFNAIEKGALGTVDAVEKGTIAAVSAVHKGEQIPY